MNLPHIKPLELARCVEPFNDRDWIFELKHDGFRALAYVADEQCRLVSRRENVYKSFDSLRAAIAQELHVKNAILDGEIVCLDALGRFDLLWLNGRDLRN